MNKIKKSDMPCDEFINLVRDVKFTYTGKEKYYTPSIEEFFIGFEFEKYDDRKAHYLNEGLTNWHKHIYDLKSIRLSQLPTHLYNNTIRVKYLDASDIEELGFEHIESTENGVNFIKYIDNPKQSIHLTLFNANHRVGIAVYNFNVNPPMVCEEIGTFGGIIKNKLELKKVLNMLNIK